MRPILVVDVVIVAIDRRGDGNDRLEGGRLECSDLQRIEPAPGNSHHADAAIRPWLGGDPFDDLNRVGKLARGVLPVDNSLRLAAATNIDAHADDSCCREYWIGGFIARRGSVSLAIGEYLQNGRSRNGGRIVRHPDTRG